MLKFLALHGAPYINDIGRLRVNAIRERSAWRSVFGPEVIPCLFNYYVPLSDVLLMDDTYRCVCGLFSDAISTSDDARSM
jgi:hypothetical protein